MILPVLIFFLLLAADQYTKQLALSTLDHGSVSVIPGLFDLHLVMNPGAAFGLFANLPDEQRRIALLGVSVVALIVVVRLFLAEAKGDRLSLFALSGILSGAVGNIIDRFRFDAVVDFLDFYLGGSHWPAFNIADSAICVGVCVLILRLGFAPSKTGAIVNAPVKSNV